MLALRTVDTKGAGTRPKAMQQVSLPTRTAETEGMCVSLAAEESFTLWRSLQKKQTAARGQKDQVLGGAPF